MGRKLMRVPMDFHWPKNQTWKGYINPIKSQECKSCDGTGLNPATKQISDTFYDFENTGQRWSDKITDDEVRALVRVGRLSDFMPDQKWYDFDEESNHWRVMDRTGEKPQWANCEEPRMPSTADVNFANSRNGRGHSHDAINRWILIRARANRLGVYGQCEFCGGEGDIWQSEEIKKLHDEWKEFDPPIGDGFQLWETTSEGSPASPVFQSLENLCEWCESNASTFGNSKTSKENWIKMLSDDRVYHQEGNAIFI
jgi:hypothetical protein